MMKVSEPVPPEIILEPTPPLRTSFPPLPDISSSPPRASIISFTSLPLTTSLNSETPKSRVSVARSRVSPPSNSSPQTGAASPSAFLRVTESLSFPRKLKTRSLLIRSNASESRSKPTPNTITESVTSPSSV